MRKSSRAAKRALFALLVATIALPLPAMTPALMSSAIGAMALIAAPAAAPELTPMVPVYFRPARGRPTQTLTPESELARLAGMADVPVDLQVWPEMIHIWHIFHPVLGAARRAIADGGVWVQKILKGA